MRKNNIGLLFSIGLAFSSLTANAQTEVELNPIYKNLKTGQLSLFLRESPQKLKQVYGTCSTNGMKGDTLWVAEGSAGQYAQLIKKLRLNLVPVEVKSDTMKTLPSAADSFLIREVNGAHFNMVKVEGDSIHQKSFLIGQTEVTQRLWISVMYSNPSEWTEKESGWPCYNQPVENVTWREVNTFINRLNKSTGRKFRLPTAHEWEFAAKGGLKSGGHKYAGSDTLQNVAWSKIDFIIGSGPHDVAQKAPNELGIYDMSGNVWELCADVFRRGGMEWVIIKGGCANEISTDCDINRKRLITSNDKLPFLGFRLVEDIE